MSGSPLFSSYKIKDYSFNNRLAVAPMTRITASESGVASEKMALYYEEFAKGGFGLIITEGIYIDKQASQTYAYQSGLVNQQQVKAWLNIAETVHRHGSRIIAQIQHAGALSQGNYYTNGSVAPSAVQPVGEQLTFYRGQGKYPMPRELTANEIDEIIDSFAQTAHRAVNEASFDGVEIHGANGYLLDQFLTEYTNQRQDKWGGDTAQRLTLILDVIKAVRAKIGDKKIIGIRISQGKVNDFTHKWAKGEDDARTVFTLLANSGVDYIHVTEHEAWQPAFADNTKSFVALAREFSPNVTIIANGGLHDIDKAEQVFETGADLIALGRGALANHNWPQRVKEGIPLDPFDRTLLTPLANIKDGELAN